MKLTVPTDLSEITLGQLQTLNDIEEAELDAIDRQKETIIALTKADRGTLDRFRLSDLKNVYDKLLYLTKKDEKLVKFVDINNTKYGFHPNLSNITTGEFADLDTLCQDLNKNLDKVMAILYREVTIEKSNKYQVKPYDGDLDIRAKLFKEKMPANVVNGAIVFFWNLGRDYLNNSLISSKEDQETLKSNSSQKSGDGTKY